MGGWNAGMSSESKSEAYDNDQTTGDNGQNNQGKGAITANPYSTVLTGKAQLNTGVTLKGVKGDVIFGATNEQLTALSSSFADTIQALSAQNNTTLQNALSQQSASGAARDNQTAGLLEGVLGKLGELSESKQTDGQSTYNKTVMYVVFGVLALLGLVFYSRRK